MASSDFRVNSLVRSTLARHWIDLQPLMIGCFRGTVRVNGKLCHLGGDGVRINNSLRPDLLEAEIKTTIPDVERVYFELANWRRNERGEWVCLDKTTQKTAGPSPVEVQLEVEDHEKAFSKDEAPARTRRSESGY